MALKSPFFSVSRDLNNPHSHEAGRLRQCPYPTNLACLITDSSFLSYCKAHEEPSKIHWCSVSQYMVTTFACHECPAPRVFLRVLRYSSLHKNQNRQILEDPDENQVRLMHLSMSSRRGGGGEGGRRGFTRSLWPEGRAFELSCCPGGRDI